MRPFKIIGPGEHIKEQMECYNWTQEDLASILGLSLKHVNAILSNKQPISLEIAKLLSQAFNQSAEYWIKLDTTYRLRLTEKDVIDNAVKIKAMLYQFMPIGEMIKRKWLPKTKDINELLTCVRNLWESDNISEEFLLKQSSLLTLKKSDAFPNFNIYYATTWLQMAKQFAKTLSVADYDRTKLKELSAVLHKYTEKPNGVALFIKELESSGVKFVCLKHFAGTYIDGASFYDGDNPVIVYTGRYDRNNNFWFTLAHEIGHILKHLKKGDYGMVDDEKYKQDSKIEQEADSFANTILLHNEILSFFEDSLSYITAEKIEQCSHKYEIDSGVIIGALAYHKTISYTHLHKYTKKVVEEIPIVNIAEG